MESSGLWDVEICVPPKGFQKIYISWPQQPPTERVSDINRKSNFWWSIPQKGTGFDHLSARDDPIISISIVVMKWDSWEATKVFEAVEVIEAAKVLRPGKSPLMTAKSSRFLNSALFWCFENKYFLLESWNIKLNFGTFEVGGCWGQPMPIFWKLLDETQMSKSPEANGHHNSTKLLIFLSLRAI